VREKQDLPELQLRETVTLMTPRKKTVRWRY